ncbi:MAG: ATP-binding protein [Gemmatimonadetes bacterium]|nr:ATP-binding protein [Gemmatimonadota bacterium]
MARKAPPENPFPAGTIVTGDDFADRQDEVALLRDELRQGGRVFLLAYRRFGKSCLIHETLRQLEAKDHALTAYVDLYRANSERELWELFANALLAASRSPLKRLLEWATGFARGFRPRFSIDPQTQQPVLTLDAPRSPAELADVREWALELPPKLAQKRERPVVVAFDEFQEIRAFDGVRLEKTLRAAFQSHRGVGYLFAGSKPHLLREMAQEGHAFYRFGRLMELAPVTEEQWAPYLTARFRTGSVDVAPAVVRAIVAGAEGIPYYVMRLCRALWSRGVRAGSLSEDDVRDVFSELVAEGDQLFAEAWDALTLAQRRTLAAVAEGRGHDVFAERVRTAYELGPSSTVARSLGRLQELSFVAREAAQARGGVRYRIVDPLLRAWVLRGRPPVTGGERRTQGAQESTPRRRARKTGRQR